MGIPTLDIAKQLLDKANEMMIAVMMNMPSQKNLLKQLNTMIMTS